MLKDKVTVEKQTFHLSQKIEIAIQITPARLDYANLRIREVMNGAQKKIDGRNEIRIENGDEFAGRRAQAFLQRARLIAFTIGAMVIFDVMADVSVFFAECFGKLVAVIS